MAVHGPKLIDVLQRAWLRGFSIQSNFAQQHAAYVAAAASLGYITTRQPDGTYSNQWHITLLGHTYLEQQE